MTDPEREHFARQVADLEGRLRRWQLVSFVLAALLVKGLKLVGTLTCDGLPGADGTAGGSAQVSIDLRPKPRRKR